MSRCLRVEAAAEFDDLAAHQHVAQNYSLLAIALNVDNTIILEMHPDRLHEGFGEADGPEWNHGAI